MEVSKETKIIDLKGYRTWMGEDGIARSEVKFQAEIDLEQAKENSKAVNSLYVDSKFPLFIDIRNIKSITREARSYFSVNGRDTHITAFAILVESELTKVIANFFFKINGSSVPAKMFTDEQKAVAWLNKYKTEKEGGNIGH